MVATVELLIPPGATSQKAMAMLDALRWAVAKTNPVNVTSHYVGSSDWLVLFGVGAPERNVARNKHVKNGRHVLLWDLAYFHRLSYLRCSIDRDHPQQYFDRTPTAGDRWRSLGIELRNDYDRKGHIVLVGIGRKSRAYLNEYDWEALRLSQLRKRFPGRDIVYRPKPGSPALALACRIDSTSPIENVLRGAALVSCRHSNVACDAIVAGVPYEADDGAAMYQQQRPFTVDNRLDFLHRLAYWQWKPDEAAQAWDFAQRIAA